jgi:hypothetical protein
VAVLALKVLMQLLAHVGKVEMEKHHQFLECRHSTVLAVALAHM